MCDYFILTKPNNDDDDDNYSNSMMKLADKKVYILPYNLIGDYILNGLFESSLIKWCKQFCDKTKTFLDIGAHTGTYSISLANYCKNVYAFEPQKMTYYALCGSVVLSNMKNIECINVALGSENCEGTLNIISEDGGGSSLLIQNDESLISKENVIVKTLDSFNVPSSISFIKIDTEGFEANVIKGSLETLKKSNYPKILFESNNENDEIFSVLQNIDYKITNIIGYNNMFFASQ